MPDFGVAVGDATHPRGNGQVGSIRMLCSTTHRTTTRIKPKLEIACKAFSLSTTPLVIKKMKSYLLNNLVRGIRTSPFCAPLKAWLFVPIYCLVAVAVGFSSNLLKLELLNSELAPLLPFTLFVFPSLLEEAFFRGILIPNNALKSGKLKVIGYIIISTVAFVVWHPLNALAINKSAIPLFLNPWFLMIVFALGIACAYSYVVSRSIWVPVIIHWATVVVWVFFLGGRNLVLEV